MLIWGIHDVSMVINTNEIEMNKITYIILYIVSI